MANDAPPGTLVWRRYEHSYEPVREMIGESLEHGRDVRIRHRNFVVEGRHGLVNREKLPTFEKLAMTPSSHTMESPEIPGRFSRKQWSQ